MSLTHPSFGYHHPCGRLSSRPLVPTVPSSAISCPHIVSVRYSFTLTSHSRTPYTVYSTYAPAYLRILHRWHSPHSPHHRNVRSINLSRTPSTLAVIDYPRRRKLILRSIHTPLQDTPVVDECHCPRSRTRTVLHCAHMYICECVNVCAAPRP